MMPVTFAEPDVLYLLWLFPLLLWMWRVRLQRIRKRLHLLASKRLDDLLGCTYSPKKAWMKGLLWCLAILLILIALARPRWGYEWQELPRGGADVMVVLDLSTSMLAQDLKPNRLEHAKRQIRDLWGVMKGDRLGLVAFAGVSFVQCPLTVDYRMIEMLLSQLTVEGMPVQGTMINQALTLSMASLVKAAASDAQVKAILLITDGEDSESHTEVIAQAKEKGIKIFTLGVGAEEGVPIPLPQGGFKKDKAGQVILSKLNDASLKALAEGTGGRYVRGDARDWSLGELYQVMAPLSEESGSVVRQKLWHERYQWFVAIAFLLFIGEWCMGSWRALMVLGVVCSELFGGGFFSGGRIYASTVGKAQQAFSEKRYTDAALGFQNAEIEEPHTPEHAYNRSVSQYQDQQFDKAAEGFAKAAQGAATLKPALAAEALYNLGNTLVAQGQLEKALEAYQQSLALQPKDTEAQGNMRWVQQKLAQKPPDSDPKQEPSQKEPSQKEPSQKESSQTKESSPDSTSQKPGDDPPQDASSSKQEKSPQTGDKGGTSQDASPEEQDASSPASASGSAAPQPHTDSEDKASGASGASEGAGLTQAEADRLLQSVEGDGAPMLLRPQMVRPKTAPQKDW